MCVYECVCVCVCVCVKARMGMSERGWPFRPNERTKERCLKWWLATSPSTTCTIQHSTSTAKWPHMHRFGWRVDKAQWSCCASSLRSLFNHPMHGECGVPCSIFYILLALGIPPYLVFSTDSH